MTTSTVAASRWTDVIADALATYPPGSLRADSVVIVLVDDERRVTGRTLIRSADPGLEPGEREALLAEAVHVLRHGHSAGESASQCLLLAFAADAVTPASACWQGSLERACASADLRALDVVSVRA